MDRGRVFGAVAAGLLREGRRVRLVARGASMAPFIRDGETVLIAPLRGLPRRGEVALCRTRGGDLLLHRVVARAGSRLVTRGDALAADDGPVGTLEALGRAVAVSGRRRLHLRPAFGRLVICGLGLRRCRLWAGPLRSLACGLRAAAARV